MKFFSFEVGMYEKGEEENPVELLIDNSKPDKVSVKVKSFYDNFTYATQNGGKSWWKK